MSDASSLVPVELRDRLDYLLCKLSETVKRRVDDTLLARFGIRGSHHALLRVLDASGPLRQLDMAGRLSVDPSTIVDLVDQLEHEQLVSRRRSTTDRRVFLLELTEAGRERLRAADPLVADLQHDAFIALTDTQRDELHELLMKLAGPLVQQAGVDPQ